MEDEEGGGARTAGSPLLWKLLMMAKGKPRPRNSGQRPGVWGRFSFLPLEDKGQAHQAHPGDKETRLGRGGAPAAITKAPGDIPWPS